MTVDRSYIPLTVSQIASLTELAAKPPSVNSTVFELERTHSATGGTHLYVRSKTRTWHIAKNGNVIELTP